MNMSMHILMEVTETVITEELIDQFVSTEVERVLNIAFDKKMIDEKFINKFKYKININRNHSYGGLYKNRITKALYPSIRLGLKKLINKPIMDYVMEFKEYDHIKDDPDIGNYYLHCREWRIYLTLLICHEIAHAIDNWFYFTPFINDTKWEYNRKECGAHRVRWRNIYKILRLEALK